jgi:RNA polymerase sigma factor (TIGR02999 family)
MFSMTDVTRILNAIEQGDPSASDKLLPLVYEELRVLARQRLANEKPGQTLQATALVHEAYLRLVGKDNDQSWDNRGHFFAAAAEAMRRVLIKRAEEKSAQKRGGDRKRIDLDSVTAALDTPAAELLELSDALNALDEVDLEAAKLIKLRFFAGLSLKEAASSLGMPVRTADRRWAYGRAWLHKRLTN